MKYLLDVNVLVAWGWSDHSDHHRVASWIAQVMQKGKDRLLTSSIPQLGFVRVSVQRTGGKVTPSTAGEVLAGMIATLGVVHEFISDDHESTLWPVWCQSASQTTDAHLLGLAHKHSAELATLDQAVPGAVLIPIVSF